MTVENKNKLRSLAAPLACAGLLLFALGLVYLFLTPKSYQAATRIKVAAWAREPGADDHPASAVAPTECGVIRSDAIVDQVIANLGLLDAWGKESGGGALSAEEARRRLLSKTSIQPVPGSSLIEIRVTSERADETARIANELARVYADSRQNKRQDALRGKFGSFKQQWEDTNRKLQDALAAQSRLYFEITRNHQGSQMQVYDADTYALLLHHRAELEEQFSSQQAQLTVLKKTDLDQMQPELPSLDNSALLASAMNQLCQARTNLISATTDHGPDSREATNANLVLDSINQRVRDLVQGAITMKETSLAALKVDLDNLDQTIKHATTNVTEVTASDPRYAKLSDEVANLRRERDDLQDKIRVDAVNSIVGTAGTAGGTIEILDSAEIPAKPFTPDRKVAIAILSTGGGMSLAGFVLLRLSRRRSSGTQGLRAV